MFSQITTPAEARRDSARMYNPMLLMEMQKWTDGFSHTTPQAQVVYGIEPCVLIGLQHGIENLFYLGGLVRISQHDLFSS